MHVRTKTGEAIEGRDYLSVLRKEEGNWKIVKTEPIEEASYGPTGICAVGRVKYFVDGPLVGIEVKAGETASVANIELQKAEQSGK